MTVLGALARRRPVLLAMLGLEVAITVLVARSPVTVALCVVLLATAAGQVAVVARGIAVTGGGSRRRRCRTASS